MVQKVFCTTCRRTIYVTIYIEEQDTPVCPVRSSPLLESVAGRSVADQGEATTKP